jgi:hypothetical protein
VCGKESLGVYMSYACPGGSIMLCASSTTLTVASVIFVIGCVILLVGVLAIHEARLPYEERFNWNDLLGRVRQARKEDKIFQMVEEVHAYGFSEFANPPAGEIPSR